MNESNVTIESKDDLLKCMRNELVPENLTVEHNGVKGLLEYRKNKNKRHPDGICCRCEYDADSKISIPKGPKTLTAYYFEYIYDIEDVYDYKEYGSSDTIFNCWSFLKRFARGVGNYSTNEDVYKNLDKIFENRQDIKEKFDKLADYHHCLANLMPAPINFNGSKYHDGKGDYYKDNDMPDVYYKRAEKDSSKKDFYKWINNHEEKLSLSFFKKFKSYTEIGGKIAPNKKVDLNNKEEYAMFIESIDNAIKCIEERANQLWKKIKDRDFKEKIQNK